ncbi:MAG: CopD family protein [Candidatus Aminicenantes bacterium]|nr:CopD family protein [Candidatus Aminicenantes bacterium]
MLAVKGKRIFFCLFAVAIWVLPVFGSGTEEYAEKTGLSCGECHLDASGGGELTKKGEAYLEKVSDESLPDQGKDSRSAWKRVSRYLRFAAGLLHVFTAIFWFGTILYVHLVLKPVYAAQGLPKGEVRVGLVSMAVMAVTGVVLTSYRVTSPSLLFETRFGILLLVKIGIFLLMVSTALVAVFFIGPRLKNKKHGPQKVDKSRLTADDLKAFDGIEGHAAYFAFRDRVYDVTKSGFWKAGLHFGRHRAGEDLTEFLDQAPHGQEKISPMPQVGEFIPSESTRTIYEKIFYFFAYFNLVAVFLIILILALWRWW